MPNIRINENVDKFGAIYVLSNHPQLKNLLLKAAQQCSVMMKRRGLYVDELREMTYNHEHESDRTLYGYNEVYGERHTIYIRLRWNENTFLEYHTILGTLLHELVHNTIHDHSSAFHKLLEEYENEVIDGNYAHKSRVSANACRLGGRVKTGSKRIILAEAAEKRRGTTNVLGGNKKKMTPREACAAAAEKRLNNE